MSVIDSPVPRVVRAPIASAMALLPIVTLVAGLSLGAAQIDPTARAEVRFLAFLAALAVAAIVGLERRKGQIAMAVAGWSVLIFWVGRPGPVRGMAIALLLSAGVALAAQVAWRRRNGDFDALSAFALALAVQALMQPRWLLRPADLDSLVHLVGLPIVIAVTWWLLRRWASPISALTLLGLTTLPGPGWRLETVVLDRDAGFGLAMTLILVVLPVGVMACVQRMRGDQGLAAGIQIAWALQRAWLGSIVVLTALAAAYPWADRAALDRILHLVGLTSSGRGLLLAASLASVTIILAMVARRLQGRHRTALATGAVSVLLAGLVLVHQPPIAKPSLVVASGAMLTQERGGWRHRLETPMSIGSIVLDTRAIASIGLADDTVVAELVLLEADEAVAMRVPVRLGRDTAEWAAERPDVAARIDRVPRQGLAFVPPDGEFFARRFRAHFDVGVQDVHQIVVRRGRGLPADFGLRIDRLEAQANDVQEREVPP